MIGLSGRSSAAEPPTDFVPPIPQPVPGPPTFDLPPVERLAADAKPDDWAEQGLRVEAMSETRPKALPPEGVAAKLLLGWDSRGLWLLAKVCDLAGKIADAWPLGSVEMVVGEHVGSGNRYRVEVFPDKAPDARLGWHDHRIELFYDPRLQPERILPPLEADVAVAKTTDGYVVEMVLPWSNLGIAPKLGSEVAFGFGATSAPSATVKDAKGRPLSGSAAWRLAGRGAGDTRTLHRLRLAQKPSPPLTTVARYAYPVHVLPASPGTYEFGDVKLYVPPDLKAVRGVYVTWPGYGSSMQVDPAKKHTYALHANRALVEKMGFALMGMTYIQGQSTPDSPATQKVLDALKHFAAETKHPELAQAPLVVDGFSQGSNFTLCNLVAKIPERIIAFGAFGYVNPQWPVSEASRKVPAVLHCGEKDQHFNRYKDVFAVNRRAEPSAPWSLTLVPGLGHDYGQCQHLALPFYATMIRLRLPEGNVDGPVKLKDVDQTQGYLGNPQTLAIAPYHSYADDQSAASWFPDRYTATVWRHLRRGETVTMQTIRDFLKAEPP